MKAIKFMYDTQEEAEKYASASRKMVIEHYNLKDIVEKQ